MKTNMFTDDDLLEGKRKVNYKFRKIKKLHAHCYELNQIIYYIESWKNLELGWSYQRR